VASNRREALHLLKEWPGIEGRVRRAGRVALFTDFDGTLTPIRPHPQQVHLPPTVRAALQALAQRGTTVGVISGRSLADVRARVGLRGIWYVGAHGYFLRSPENRTAALLRPDQMALMRSVHRQLRAQIGFLPGIRIESKQATVAVHYRQASSHSRRQACPVIRGLLRKHPKLTLLSGKKVWELLPESRVSKWTAIEHILRLERARRGGRWLVFYLGDDTTDERVFESMRGARIKGISVVVGKRRSAAQFFLRSPAEAASFLEKLCGALR